MENLLINLSLRNGGTKDSLLIDYNRKKNYLQVKSNKTAQSILKNDKGFVKIIHFLKEVCYNYHKYIYEYGIFVTKKRL